VGFEEHMVFTYSLRFSPPTENFWVCACLWVLHSWLILQI